MTYGLNASVTHIWLSNHSRNFDVGSIIYVQIYESTSTCQRPLSTGVSISFLSGFTGTL